MKISVLPLHLEPKTTALRKARNCPPSKGVVSKILFDLNSSENMLLNDIYFAPATGVKQKTRGAAY